MTAALDLGLHAIDTAFNYHGFNAHKTLARVAGDLLPQLAVSTKVGFFPRPGHAEHSLVPSRLLGALTQTNRDLGRPPDLVFLHNPERSLRGPADQAREALAQACQAMDEASQMGLCRSWGVASWDPSALTGLIDDAAPGPSVLMVRAGLLVDIGTLDAAEAPAARWSPSAVWGMSPFGGDADAPVWDMVDPRIFLHEPSAEVSRVQAAFRTAYDLPAVDTVAVGTDDPSHLRELFHALPQETDRAVLLRYRLLLRERQAVNAPVAPQ